MSEGEFKKWEKRTQKELGMFQFKIAELMGTPKVYRYKSHAFLIPQEDMAKVVDEARKEIFEEVQRLNRTGRSVPMLENVLLKWFGAKSP